ncbi:hypothetical protein H4R33_007025, partial [Dimargaris cristalligena]
MALALLLSRYHRQPAVAFTHWTGPIGGEAAGQQLRLVLAQVKPDVPLNSSILQETGSDYLPSPTDPVAEVILRVDNAGPSKNQPMFPPTEHIGQPSESDADPSSVAILLETTARLMVSCEWHHGQARITVTYARAQYRGSAVAEFALQLGTVLLAVVETTDQ